MYGRRIQTRARNQPKVPIFGLVLWKAETTAPTIIWKLR
jgi:hypothetical protein